jgi:hypothetical protein
MNRSISLACFLSFVAGVTLTNVVWAFDAAAGYFFNGAPVVCRDSFPRYHTACVYSRPGFGEQAVAYQIDGETVFHTEDFAGGDLKADVIWDSKGSSVTFYAHGLGARTFDPNLKNQIARTSEEY